MIATSKSRGQRPYMHCVSSCLGPEASYCNVSLFWAHRRSVLTRPFQNFFVRKKKKRVFDVHHYSGQVLMLRYETYAFQAQSLHILRSYLFGVVKYFYLKYFSGFEKLLKMCLTSDFRPLLVYTEFERNRLNGAKSAPLIPFDFNLGFCFSSERTERWKSSVKPNFYFMLILFTGKLR